jgi:hypothetical protein
MQTEKRCGTTYLQSKGKPAKNPKVSVKMTAHIQKDTAV